MNNSNHYGHRDTPPGMVPQDKFRQSLFFNALHRSSRSSDSSPRPPSSSLSFEAYCKREHETQHLRRPLSELLSIPNSIPREDTDPIRKVLSEYCEEDIEPTYAQPDDSITFVEARLASFRFNPDRDTDILPPGDFDACLYDLLTPQAIKTATISFEEDSAEFVEPFETPDVVYEFSHRVHDVNTQLQAHFNKHQLVVRSDAISVLQDVEPMSSHLSEDSAIEDDMSETPRATHKKRKIVRNKICPVHNRVKPHYPDAQEIRAERVTMNQLRRKLHKGVGVHQFVRLRIRANRSVRITRCAKFA